MAHIKKSTPWDKEWAALRRQEDNWLRRNAQYKPSALNRLLEGKVPPRLRSTLDTAFAKAFALVFEKGTPLLERTFSPDALSTQHQVDQFSAQLRQDRKSLRTFSRRSARAGAVNLALSGVEGVALGVLGVGLPDIPVFTALLLRSLCEMACHFGFPYDTPEERYFQLLLIQGALSYGDELADCCRALDEFIAAPALPRDFDRSTQTDQTARALSSQLLYTKFLQGIPVVGAAGGACDVVCLNRVQRFARLKYRRRLLLRQKSLPGA